MAWFGDHAGLWFGDHAGCSMATTPAMPWAGCTLKSSHRRRSGVTRVNGIIQTLRNLGPNKLSAMAAVAFGLIGFFIYVSTRMGTAPMELLYAELQQADAAAIAEKLDQMQVPYQVDANGTRIRVPSDQIGKIRMSMAQKGLPTGGITGYSIFDKQEGFGTTSFVQNINHLRALEGEMARTVGTLAQVQTARVHLVLPRRELFSRTENKATASIFVKLRPGAQLGREQIGAIQHLIASSVPGLEPSRVSIVDDKGNLLARGMDAGSEELLLATAEEKRRSYEQRISRTIEDVVGRAVGHGRVRAEVSADLDFDRITTNSESFDPESVVTRSTQTVNESSDTQDRDPLAPVTVNNNLPTNAGESQNTGPISSTKTSRTEETVNNEISKTTRSHVRESGQVRRLSVAVLVDYKPEKNADGSPPNFVPRSKEEMAQLETVVRSAVGYDPVRGDEVQVINMRFAAPDDELAERPGELIFGLPKDDVFRIAEIVILGIVGILIMLLVVRPLIMRFMERAQEDEEMDLLADQTAMQALAAPSGALAQDLAMEAQQADEELEQMIDINRVEGRVRASSLRKVGEIVDKHPEEAVSIIRNWLYQET